MKNVHALPGLILSRSSLLFTALALFGCSGDESAFSTQGGAGTERGPCRSGRTCDPGLVCASDVCVRMPDGGSATGGSSSSTGGASSGGQTSSGGSPGNGGAMGNGGATGKGGATGNGGSAGNGGTSGGAGGTATGGSDAGGGASGAGGTQSSGGASGSGGSDGGVECRGSHPNVQGQRRFCDVGSCYCTDPFDTCFSGATADSCCNNTPICGDSQSGGGVDCTGTHPTIGPPRTCNPGFCLCSGSTVDTCYPAIVADACCPPSITPVCVPN